MLSIPKLLAALLPVALTALPLPALAEWVPVTANSKGIEMQVDFDSIVRRGNVVSFWERSVMPLPEPTTGLSIVGFYYSIDCYTAKAVMHRSVGINTLRNVVFDEKTHQVINVKPNTPGADIYNAVCQ